MKIGEFSALSGISRQLLIYYDNEAILHPKQADLENGYRYYSYRQLTSASVIVSLRQAGMSLECIRNYLTELSPEKLITLFHEQEHNLEEQIRKLEHIKSMVQSRLHHTEQGILIGSEKIWVEDCPEENLFLGPDLPENFQLSDGWDWLPSFYKSCMEHGIQIGFTVGSLVEFDASKAMLSDKPIKYFCRLPQDQYPDYYIKPAGHYIVGTQYTNYEHTDALYWKIFRYMDEHGLKICGNAERFGPWETVYSRFRKWIEDGFLDNIFRILSMDAELSEVSIDASIVQAHQHSAGARKDSPPNEIGHSRGGPSTKIHAAVDAYGYPVYIMISEGQRNDINFAIPVLEHINIEGSNVLADRGYDSNKLIDYIYGRGGEPTIPSRKGAKFERRCDWWLYKERHLVEKLFLKLKSYRRIATRYDKLPFTYLGFICIVSILIWLN